MPAGMGSRVSWGGGGGGPASPPPTRAASVHGDARVGPTRTIYWQHAYVRRPAPMTACLLVARVYEEAVQPDLETLRFPQARKLAPRKQEGLLDSVLRPLDIAQDAVRDRITAVAIQVDELGEGVFVAVTRSLDQRRKH